MLNYNPYLDHVKFILACMVIYIHFVIQSNVGSAIDCVARIAVPFFFLISGYYSYNREIKVLRKRFIRNLFFLIGISFLYFLWGIWNTVVISHSSIASYLHESFNKSSIVKFFIFGVNPFSNHLWFLEALVVSYLIHILMIKFVKNEFFLYRLLFIIMILTLCGHYVLGTIIPLFTGKAILNYYYRNVWLFGFPMFTMGLLIHYAEANGVGLQIIKNRAFQFYVLVIGLVLGLFQWFKFGHVEMPLGMLMVSVVVFLCVLEMSNKKEQLDKSVCYIQISKLLGNASIWIYVIHKFVGEIIRAYVPYSSICSSVVANIWLFPFVVMLISILVSLIMSTIICKVKRRY